MNTSPICLFNIKIFSNHIVVFKPNNRKFIKRAMCTLLYACRNSWPHNRLWFITKLARNAVSLSSFRLVTHSSPCRTHRRFWATLRKITRLRSSAQQIKLTKGIHICTSQPITYARCNRLIYADQYYATHHQPGHRSHCISARHYCIYSFDTHLVRNRVHIFAIRDKVRMT